MPSYDFRCKKCGKKCSLKLTVQQMESHRYKCPKCGSKQLEKLVTGFFAQTSNKS
jgi:putative FmdB family regulatory protein